MNHSEWNGEQERRYVRQLFVRLFLSFNQPTNPCKTFFFVWRVTDAIRKMTNKWVNRSWWELRALMNQMFAFRKALNVKTSVLNILFDGWWIFTNVMLTKTKRVITFYMYVFGQKSKRILTVRYCNIIILKIMITITIIIIINIKRTQKQKR